ncbi:MAG TPA: hypothetical protein VEB00_05965 [Clostridia bacterium]|nr:hypothetical protein [Clostridia bacterium]
MTRFERNRNRKALKKVVLVLFLVIVPLTAVAASIFFMNIYNKGSSMEALGGTPSNSVVAFKYNYEINSKALYRIELQSSESFEEAGAYLKSIKAKKLNGFIVKEKGYKVIYGVFVSQDEADKVQDSIAVKVKGSIVETRLPGYSLKYNETDNTFIQLVQATDKLIWETAKSKSMISQEIALKSNVDLAPALEEISKGEVKLEKYLGYAENINVSKEQMVFRENFVILLKEVLAHKLDNEKDYYRIQDGMMNQLEAYKKFIGKLLI